MGTCLVPNQSEKCGYDPNLVEFNNIRKNLYMRGRMLQPLFRAVSHPRVSWFQYAPIYVIERFFLTLNNHYASRVLIQNNNHANIYNHANKYC